MNRLVVVGALAIASVVACSKPSNDSTASPPSAPASTATTAATSESNDNGGGGGGTAEAATIFKTRCSTCHGMEGKGNGPAAITLNPKPRNYTDVAWQKSVTDEHIHEIIIKGGAAVGKSPLMPPNPDLENKPQVVDALVKKVRSFGATD